MDVVTPGFIGEDSSKKKAAIPFQSLESPPHPVTFPRSISFCEYLRMNENLFKPLSITVV
jgi:hypothetical protein